MNDLEPRIAEVLAEHGSRGPINSCLCGWLQSPVPNPEDPIRIRNDFATHQAAMLAPLIRDAPEVRRWRIRATDGEAELKGPWHEGPGIRPEQVRADVTIMQMGHSDWWPGREAYAETQRDLLEAAEAENRRLSQGHRVSRYCTPGTVMFPDAAGCLRCDSERLEALVKKTGDWTQGFGGMVVCATCGNKRCPKATYHGNDCTGSNEMNQPGSAYQLCRCEYATDDDRLFGNPSVINPNCTAHPEETPNAHTN